MLTDRELATVLASLRAIQNVQQHEALAPEIMDIATDGDRFSPLSDREIDNLCSRLTFMSPTIFDPLIYFCETAPRTDPGEGYWDNLEATFGCGENAAIYQAAEMLRGFLSKFGIDAERIEGIALCEGCSRHADSDDHDPDCSHPIIGMTSMPTREG